MDTNKASKLTKFVTSHSIVLTENNGLLVNDISICVCVCEALISVLNELCGPPVGSS